MIKVLFAIGTRPEAIKMAPVIKTLEESDKFHVHICSTGQHREMLNQVFNFFDIKPDIELNIMKQGQTLAYLTSSISIEMDKLIQRIKPDIVIVQGDTTTAFISALIAFYNKISIAHIEAGLRTKNKYSPFPEEANRAFISRIADYHFAPTELSADNLISEGIDKDRIFVTGNTVVDALLEGKDILYSNNKLIESYNEKYSSIRQNRFILVTGHRRENFGDKFKNFCSALNRITEKLDFKIVYPVHLNPNVQKPVYSILGDNDNILLIDPVDYSEMIWLMDQCYIVITDSGGIQEEAPTFGKPVLVTRDVTERPEGIEAGVSLLIGTDKKKIFEAVKKLDNKIAYDNISQVPNPYGDGTAAEQIRTILEQELHR